MTQRDGSSDVTGSPANPGERICYACRYVASEADLTCRHCGVIFEPYLLGMITGKSLTGPQAEAFQKGAQDCKAYWKLTKQTSVAPAAYKPWPGCHDAYRAGWKKAADALDGRIHLEDMVDLSRPESRKKLSFVLMGGGLMLFFLIDTLQPPNYVKAILTSLMVIGIFGGLGLYFSSN